VKRLPLPLWLAIASFAVPQAGIAQDDSPGWTGITDPQGVIAARLALMLEMERLMRPIDSLTVGEPIEPEVVRSSATSIAAMLIATPHLFPPTTDLYDDSVEEPETIALPAVWKNFGPFTALAESAANAATTLGSASEPAALDAGAVALRAACDACHAVYLLPYEPSEVTSEDLNFDFDALFEGFDNAEESPQ